MLFHYLMFLTTQVYEVMDTAPKSLINMASYGPNLIVEAV